MSIYSYDYERPAMTADIVLFSFRNSKVHTLLVQRKFDPFAGSWAFPGGFVDADETVEMTAVRELWEETGLHKVELNQLYTDTALKRDPRGWTITVGFFGIVSSIIEALAGDDAEKAEWLPIHESPTLVFGHEIFLRKAIEKCRYQLLHTVFGKELLPKEFSLKTLYKLYLQIIDIPEQVEKIVKRLINHGVLIQIGENWRFEKSRCEIVRKVGFLR